MKIGANVDMITNQAVNTYRNHTEPPRPQDTAPRGADHATISREARQAAEAPEDTVSLGKYLDRLSPQERTYFKASIASRFSDSTDNNLAVAMDAAEQTMSRAEQQGTNLDIDEVYLSIKNTFGLEARPTIDFTV